MEAALGRVARHRAQIAMDHRLAADKEQVADVIFQGDVNNLLRLVKCHAATRLGVKFGAGKAAEITVGIAYIRDGKLQIAGATVIQNFADEFERSLFWPRDGLRKVNFGRRNFFRHRRSFSNGIFDH